MQHIFISFVGVYDPRILSYQILKPYYSNGYYFSIQLNHIVLQQQHGFVLLIFPSDLFQYKDRLSMYWDSHGKHEPVVLYIINIICISDPYSIEFARPCLPLQRKTEVTALHYNDVIMRAMASQITSHTIVYSTICSGSDQRKHQSSASLAFVWGIHRWPVKFPHKWSVTRKCFQFMTSSWVKTNQLITTRSISIDNVLSV